MEYIAEISVTGELLSAGLRKIFDWPAKDRDSIGRVVTLCTLLARRSPNANFNDWLNHAKAIDFRLQALVLLYPSAALRAWVESAAMLDVAIEDSIYNAAATERLIFENGVPRFDLDSLSRRILALANAQGRA
jgi:hypothetical protein